MIAIIVFALLVLAFFPIAAIWALNTLFALDLAFTFVNWLAAVILITSVGLSRSR